jgi:ELWxxDGT repeat protein
VPGTRLLRNIDLRTDHSVDLTSGWRVGDRLLVPHRNDSAADTLVSSLGTPQSTGIAVDLAAFAPFTELGTSAVVAGERLCFMAGYFAGGYFDALLSTDGTPGGTRMEYQIPGPHVSSSSQLIVVGGEVWIAYNASNSIWLYRHNPVTGQTMQFATVGGFISKWERLGNGALLESSSGGVRSFRYTDGTGAGTVQVYSPSVDRASTAMMVGDSAAYFVHDPFVGSPVFATVYEMRRTMGTAGSTSLVCSSSSAIRFLGRLAGNDLLFFGSVDGMPLGLYRTTGDGTAVERLSGVTPDLSAFSGATLNGVSYFSGRTTANGAELWRSDGTAGGTYIVADLVPGTSSSSPRGFYADGNAVYFTTIQSGGTAKVWTTDGTAAGTRLVFTTPTAGALEPKFLGTSEHGVFFAAMSGVLGYELHVLRPGLADCNNNLVHDEVDVLAGLSLDGNLDGRPDECCRGDFNADGLVLVQDIFDFLNGWFLPCP